MSKNYDEDYAKTIKASLIPEKNWIVMIEGTIDEECVCYKVLDYNDAEFKSIGFPVALLFNSLVDKDLYFDYDWVYDVLDEFFPEGDFKRANAIKSVTVLKNGKKLNISKIDQNVANEAIIRYIDALAQNGIELQIDGDFEELGFSLKRIERYED